MKLLEADQKQIKDHFSAIIRQNWKKSKKRETLTLTARGYCQTFPDNTIEVSALYTAAKKAL